MQGLNHTSCGLGIVVFSASLRKAREGPTSDIVGQKNMYYYDF